MATLMAYPFPGNVRELENAIEHAFVVCVGETIQLEDLPPHLIKTVESGAAPKPEHRDQTMKPLKNAEAEVIKNVLAAHHGNRSRAAAELGVSRSTLWRKMKKHDIPPG